MTLAPGSRLGPYEVTAKLGEGGMGEVWRATDTKLRRDVAVKVLPAAFTEDRDRLARFEREAQLLAQLNHSNIAQIYGLEASGEAHALVMELVEGPTLADRLASGPLPLEEALAIARQIAEALEEAHEKGIIHRDLKPQNVKAPEDGAVKVLDFGLAKALGTDGDPTGIESGELLTQSPTLAAGATLQGVLLGTAAYMAPEQAKGRAVDKRADIWAFGVVLHEMLTGAKLFTGDSVPDTLARVLRSEIDLAALPAETPAAIRRLLRRCLQRNPKDRLHDVADARIVIDEGMAGADDEVPGPPPAATPRPSSGRAVALTAVLIAALAAYVAGRLTTPAPPPAARATGGSPRMFRQLTETPGVEQSPTLSPDGRDVVFVADGGGNLDLYLLRVGDRKPRALTADSPSDDSSPMFSPDGEHIAFRSERDGGGVFVMSATGESVRRVTDFGFDPSWSPDGKEIVVSTVMTGYPTDVGASNGDLVAVEVATGKRRLISRGTNPLRPRWSPHGARVGFWTLRRGSGQRDVYTVAADGSEADTAPVAVTDDSALDWSPAWSPDGRFLYFSSLLGGTMNLWRVAIDETSGRVLDEPEPVTAPSAWSGEVSFARDGRRFAFSTLDWSSKLQRIGFDERTGTLRGSPQPMLESTHPIRDHRVSPDGQWVVMTLRGAQEDLAITRVDGSHFLRLTDDAFRDRAPMWSPDGSRIFFFSDRSGGYELWSIRPDGSGLELLTPGEDSVALGAISPDGRQIAAASVGAGNLLFDTASSTRPLPSRKLSMSVSEGGVIWAETWSPDGARLAGPVVASDGTTRGIAVYSLADGRTEQVFDSRSNLKFLLVAWLSDSRRLIVRGERGIWLLDTVTRETKPLLSVGGYWIGESVDVARDGSWISWTETATEGDVWLAELAGEGEEP